MWLASTNNRDKYRTFKNDVVYNRNNFTPAELQAIDKERLSILDKANRQKTMGGALVLVGGAMIGVSFILPAPPPQRGLPPHRGNPMN